MQLPDGTLVDFCTDAEDEMIVLLRAAVEALSRYGSAADLVLNEALERAGSPWRVDGPGIGATRLALP